MQALNAEYSELAESMSRLGTSFTEKLASLKAQESTTDIHSEIDALHYQSRVR